MQFYIIFNIELVIKHLIVIINENLTSHQFTQSHFHKSTINLKSQLKYLIKFIRSLSIPRHIQYLNQEDKLNNTHKIHGFEFEERRAIYFHCPFENCIELRKLKLEGTDFFSY